MFIARLPSATRRAFRRFCKVGAGIGKPEAYRGESTPRADDCSRNRLTKPAGGIAGVRSRDTGVPLPVLLHGFDIVSGNTRGEGHRRALPPNAPAWARCTPESLSKAGRRATRPRREREFPAGGVSTPTTGGSKCSISSTPRTIPTTPLSIPTAHTMPNRATPHLRPTPARCWPRSECRPTRSAKFSAPGHIYRGGRLNRGREGLGEV